MKKLIATILALVLPVSASFAAGLTTPDSYSLDKNAPIEYREDRKLHCRYFKEEGRHEPTHFFYRLSQRDGIIPNCNQKVLVYSIFEDQQAGNQRYEDWALTPNGVGWLAIRDIMSQIDKSEYYKYDAGYGVVKVDGVYLYNSLYEHSLGLTTTEEFHQRMRNFGIVFPWTVEPRIEEHLFKTRLMGRYFAVADYDLSNMHTEDVRTK